MLRPITRGPSLLYSSGGKGGSFPEPGSSARHFEARNAGDRGRGSAGPLVTFCGRVLKKGPHCGDCGSCWEQNKGGGGYCFYVSLCLVGLFTYCLLHSSPASLVIVNRFISFSSLPLACVHLGYPNAPNLPTLSLHERQQHQKEVHGTRNPFNWQGSLHGRSGGRGGSRGKKGLWWALFFFCFPLSRCFLWFSFATVRSVGSWPVKSPKLSTGCYAEFLPDAWGPRRRSVNTAHIRYPRLRVQMGRRPKHR